MILCPDCGTELVGGRHGRYDCPACLTTFTEDRLGRDQDSDHVLCVCPKCKVEVEMEPFSGRDGPFYQCPDCFSVFFPAELSGVSEDDDSIYFGRCSHCGEATVFEKACGTYFCGECGTVSAEISELATEIWNSVTFKNGWMCCPSCSTNVEGLTEDESGALFEGQKVKCSKCGLKFELRRGLKSTCTKCETSTPNVLYLGMDTKEQRFLCLDCNATFEAPLQLCPSCETECGVSVTSAFGLLLYCPTCNRTFNRTPKTRTSSVSRTYSTGRYSGWDDDDWSYLTKPKKPLEQLVEERFIVECDL